jgi:hypothetical protein
VAKLKVEIAQAQTELDQMRKEFMEYKTSREDDYNSSLKSQNEKKLQYAEKVEMIKQMKEEM